MDSGLVEALRRSVVPVMMSVSTRAVAFSGHWSTTGVIGLMGVVAPAMTAEVFVIAGVGWGSLAATLGEGVSLVVSLTAVGQ